MIDWNACTIIVVSVCVCVCVCVKKYRCIHVSVLQLCVGVGVCACLMFVNWLQSVLRRDDVEGRLVDDDCLINFDFKFVSLAKKKLSWCWNQQKRVLFFSVCFLTFFFSSFCRFYFYFIKSITKRKEIGWMDGWMDVNVFTIKKKKCLLFVYQIKF